MLLVTSYQQEKFCFLRKKENNKEVRFRLSLFDLDSKSLYISFVARQIGLAYFRRCVWSVKSPSPTSSPFRWISEISRKGQSPEGGSLASDLLCLFYGPKFT